MSPAIEHYLNLEYPIHVYPDQCTDGSFCYVAQHPDLPGCSAHGDTIEDARVALAHARIAYMSHLFRIGKRPPAPGIGPGELLWSWAELLDEEPSEWHVTAA